MFGAGDLKIIEALPFIRGNAAMFFSSGSASTPELIRMVAGDIAFAGCGPSEACQREGVVTVCAVGDWMETGAPVAELFAKIHATPSRGPNTHRHEIIVAAFSRVWGTRGAAGAAGEPDADVKRALSEAGPKWGRLLAWKVL